MSVQPENISQSKFSLGFLAFCQALGLVIYCSLVGVLLWQGGQWFGPMLGFLPMAFVLVLFVASALISALIVLGYPLILFWVRKQTTTALRLVVYTAAWLVLFVLLIILMLMVV